MKRLVFLLVTLLASGCEAIANQDGLDGIEAVSVVKVTQEVLADAQVELEKEGLEIVKVSLGLNVVADAKTEGGLKILFFKAGGSKQETVSNKITVELTPPENDTKSRDVGESITREQTKKLVAAIISIAKSMKPSAQEEFPLEVTSISGDLTFVVKRGKNGGVSGLELAPVSIDLGGSSTNAFEQKLTIVMKK